MYKRDIYVISSYSSKLTTLFNSEKKLEVTKHANSENTPLRFNEQFLLRSNSAENPNSSHDESKTLTPQCLLFLSPSLSRVLFLVSSRSDSRFPLGFSSKCVAGGRRRGGTRCLHIRGDLTWLRKPLCRHDHGKDCDGNWLKFCSLEDKTGVSLILVIWFIALARPIAKKYQSRGLTCLPCSGGSYIICLAISPIIYQDLNEIAKKRSRERNPITSRSNTLSSNACIITICRPLEVIKDASFLKGC